MDSNSNSNSNNKSDPLFSMFCDEVVHSSDGEEEKDNKDPNAEQWREFVDKTILVNSDNEEQEQEPEQQERTSVPPSPDPLEAVEDSEEANMSTPVNKRTEVTQATQASLASFWRNKAPTPTYTPPLSPSSSSSEKDTNPSQNPKRRPGKRSLALRNPAVKRKLDFSDPPKPKKPKVQSPSPSPPPVVAPPATASKPPTLFRTASSCLMSSSSVVASALAAASPSSSSVAGIKALTSTGGSISITSTPDTVNLEITPPAQKKKNNTMTVKHIVDTAPTTVRRKTVQVTSHLTDILTKIAGDCLKKHVPNLVEIILECHPVESVGSMLLPRLDIMNERVPDPTPNGTRCLNIRGIFAAFLFALLATKDMALKDLCFQLDAAFGPYMTDMPDAEPLQTHIDKVYYSLFIPDYHSSKEEDK